MRLIRARMENFRLLRDLDLQFSVEPNHKLTVIRAANESGKTTLLHALQWALYGDEALPGKGQDFRLHPIDWDADDGSRVPITVEVEFEVIKYNKVGNELLESRRTYRIVRSTFEEIDGKNWKRSPSSVQLFALGDSGAHPVDMPEAVINDELPGELRDVFFTDGDRALSFIESDVALSTKRERVQRAIRSLLGLGVLQKAKERARRAGSDINKQAKALGGDSALAQVTSIIDKQNEDLISLGEKLRDAKEQFTAFDEKYANIEKAIDETLKRGDREKLQQELDASKRAIKRLDQQVEAANKAHSALFKSEALARDLLRPVLSKAFAKLKELHDRGKIPNATIPVLEDRLAVGSCICGESLEEDGGEGQNRRQHVCELIERSRKADEVQSLVTDLYFGSRSLEARPDDVDGSWTKQLAEVFKQRSGLQSLRDEEGRKFKSLEVTLDKLPDTDIQQLREVRRGYLAQRDRFGAEVSKIETQIAGIEKHQEQLVRERDRLLRHQKKGERIIAELAATNDIAAVLERSYDRIVQEELTKVSSLMNSIFLEMIGADPEQGALIRRAEISKDFDILVEGPESRTLNPDRDLNGASRRALTLAFILALTRVSEVEAPNVIDTPLGMMSGYVKRQVLKTAVRESAQLILFLTHDEIAGCEDVLDEFAGSVCTLTNPAHYPKMLVHDPKVAQRRVLRCGCTHRESCSTCERRADALELEPASRSDNNG